MRENDANQMFARFKNTKDVYWENTVGETGEFEYVETVTDCIYVPSTTLGTLQTSL